MIGLNMPGLTCWLSKSPDPKRKLPHTWELVEVPGEKPGEVTIAGLNTMHPNRVVAEALAAGAIPELAGYDIHRGEVKYGQASRVDFLLERSDAARRLETKASPSSTPLDLKPDHRVWLEVKNCHPMRSPGLAEFPECVAARLSKHLREL